MVSLGMTWRSNMVFSVLRWRKHGRWRIFLSLLSEESRDIVSLKNVRLHGSAAAVAVVYHAHCFYHGVLVYYWRPRANTPLIRRYVVYQTRGSFNRPRYLKWRLARASFQ